ncbi:adenylate/guanylate cyclase domain-containing protein [Oceanicella sp. SM1341]|uniref:adenylate/guanylate cyclase domain-containing protein n=1 Tax=Oceanicella sp. SM1341 TaxID=1548889 RepID=UPI000E543189|nr:adenylate/guanylate cyclase domain-containing protein [Oceanicella sp. SM1341]
MQHDVLIQEIQGWLLDETLRDPDIVSLFASLCARLRAAGIPLDRAALTWPTLHPLFQAEQIYWRRDSGTQFHQYRHDAGMSEAFLASPFYHVISNQISRLRRKLSGPEALRDFSVLDELQEQGYTDYLLTSTTFRIARVERTRHTATGILASWSTRREDGFSDDDIVALSRIQKVFAVACHAAIQMRVMQALGEAYLGRIAADRIFAGEARLGDGAEIRAVVWYSDLRGSTWLSGHMSPADYLDYLRNYYACTAEPVLAQGGEILDFIGDGVLAIFPVKGDLGGPEAVRAATRAMEGALDCLETYRRNPENPEMQFSISLALGDVMFGNIGVPTRLSFSAIGEVVNTVARIDDLSKTVGRSVLATEAIASVEPDLWLPIGPANLTDHDRPLPLYAPRCGRDIFDEDQLRSRFLARLAG